MSQPKKKAPPTDFMMGPAPTQAPTQSASSGNTSNTSNVTYGVGVPAVSSASDNDNAYQRAPVSGSSAYAAQYSASGGSAGVFLPPPQPYTPQYTAQTAQTAQYTAQTAPHTAQYTPQHTPQFTPPVAHTPQYSQHSPHSPHSPPTSSQQVPVQYTPQQTFYTPQPQPAATPAQYHQAYASSQLSAQSATPYSDSRSSVTLSPNPSPSVAPSTSSDSKQGVTRRRAPPVDFQELPLPDGYYRQSYKVVMPGMHSLSDDSKYDLRYTAATSNWDDFANPSPSDRKPYTLIQQERGYTTKLFIIVTMYNEDSDLFVQTMGGVYECIEFMVDRHVETGLNANNIVVAIICDGRSKCPKEVKMALELLGCYQSDELIMTDFQDHPVQAHLFEHTSKSHVAIKDRKRKEMHLVPSRVETQYLVCMKEHNRRKIDSHGWAFRAFAPILKPDVVVLFDMGTKPEKEALYHLWMHFYKEPQLGGACGEIKVRVEAASGWGKAFKLLTDPLLASQNFEYKMSNILDKSLQSVFGYITVLPGAFSAYRYAAIEGRPLEEYFAREFPPKEEDSKEPGTCSAILTANKYLAEDRILCFEVFTKEDEDWLMRYVKEARANTDAPDKLFQFLNQRRRWFNGSMFAFLSAFFSMGAVSRSSHTGNRKALFYIEMVYLMVDLIFSLLGPMFFYGVFITMFSEFFGTLAERNKWDENVAPGLTSAMTFIYSLMFLFGMLLFVGNNPRGSSWVYKLLSGFWGLLIIFIVVLIIGNGVRTFNEVQADPNLQSVYQVFVYIFSLLLTYGLYIISSLVFRDPAHIFTSMPGYMLLLPTYINMMLPFALANIHDVSWGTRAEDPEARDLPRNKLGDGKAVLSDLLRPEDHGLVVDVDAIESLLNMSDEGKEKYMDRKTRALARKNKRAATQDDRNKNVRMVLLLFFLVANMGGAIAITYYGVVQKNQVFRNVYGGIVFGAVFGFALIKFFGCVFFVMKTPKYTGDIRSAKEATD